MFRFSPLSKIQLTMGLAVLLVAHLSTAMGHHSAYVVMGYDAYPVPFFTGTSNPPSPPSGFPQISTAVNNPGYLNGISGGANNGATGNVSIMDAQFETAGATELVAAAITVSDSAGNNHSLSSKNDPVLSAIVNDLNNPPLFGLFPVTAYPFNESPPQFADDISALSAGESANGGQPFDILLSITNNNAFPSFPFATQAWAFDFSNEVDNLVGVKLTSLQVTDIGAIPGVVPEPATVSLITPAALLILKRRRREPRQR